MIKPFSAVSFGRWLCTSLIIRASLVLAQPAPAPGIPLILNDLSAFKSPAANWRIVGNVRADLAKANALTTQPGTGILANIPLPVKAGQSQYGQQFNLLTNLQHGDADIELDYMMAKGSNSGVYLQGRYEVQLFDSWDVRAPKVVDNGSIYERWDEKRPDGRQGYEGHPARQNASRAPGLWQHLRISFQAPRFNAQGQKTENARMLRVELNGVLIHEDVELTGPTRAAAFNDEQPTGPLMFQGDHGAVAFRNIRYVVYDKPRPQLTGLTYSVYKGKFDKEPEFDKLAPEAKGTTPLLTAGVSTLPNEYLVRYVGTLRVAEPGEYNFNLAVPGGGGMLKVNNQPVIAPGEWNVKGKATLPKGDLPFELLYARLYDWAQPGIGLSVAGPGVREFIISDKNGGAGQEVDPILVNETDEPILRSFMDLPGIKDPKGKDTRVTHAVSVGSPTGVHYTYDLDKGALVQVWRGQFLDATPMWHDRGDGSSRPLGMVQRMGAPVLFLTKLASPQTNWATDTTGSGFRPKGYVLDSEDRPTFRYRSYGASVDDKIRVLANGQGIQREVTITNLANDLYARLAGGTIITALETGLYLIDGQQYVRLDDLGGATATVRDTGKGQELIAPVKNKLIYSILF